MMKKLLLFFMMTLLLHRSLLAQPKQGQLAEEIALPTPAGDTLRLSAFKGKIVLLDFWASWCGPCRIANRGLAKIYSKFRDQDFEIFSVSIDDDKKDWIKAIKKDNITWKQVNSPGSWSSPIARKWQLEAMPTTYLIDKQGVLVAMDLEGKQLEDTIKFMLGK